MAYELTYVDMDGVEVTVRDFMEQCRPRGVKVYRDGGIYDIIQLPRDDATLMPEVIQYAEKLSGKRACIDNFVEKLDILMDDLS